MKITLSSGKMLMPEVGRQKREFGIQILAVLIPAAQGTNGEQVTSVVDPGPLASPAVRDSTLQQQLTKQRVHGA
jgi:hypothetical protein